MDFIQRLGIVLLFLIPSLYSTNANATYTATTKYYVGSWNTTTAKTTQTLACQHFASYSGSTYYYVYTSNTNTSCYYAERRKSDNSLVGNRQDAINTIYDCSGVLQTTNVCAGNPPPPPCTAGEIVSTGVYDGGQDPNAAFPNSACYNGCSVTFEGTWPKYQREQGDGMHYYAEGDYGKTGTTCTATPSNSPPSATATPPLSIDQQAQAEADANAKAAAAAKAAADKAAADAKAAADKAAANAAAKTAAEAKTAQDKATAAAKAAADKAAATNSDPNATQADKDAANADATAKAATSAAADAAYATAAGAAAGEQKDTPPEPQKDFCESHPDLQVCKTSSINGGFCHNGELTGFSCDGEAVACEHAKTSAKQYCFNTKTDTNLITKYNEAMNDNGLSNPALAANRTIIHLPTSLDASSPYVGGCNQDLTISVGGSTVTLPFSAWCGVLEALGYLFLACAYISAALIIGGSV